MIALRLALAVLLAAFTLVAGLKGAADGLAPAEPGRALDVFPGHAGAHGEISGRLAADDFSANRAAVLGHSAAVLKRAPLAAEPLIYRALAEAEDGNVDGARRLARQAIDRNVRTRAAYLFLLEGALREGRVDETLETLDTLFTLDRANRNSYYELLVALAQEETARPALMAALSREPDWAGGLAGRVLRALGPSHFVYDIVRQTGEAQGAFVQALARAGRHDEAFLAWLIFLSDAGGALSGWPHDGRFEGLSGTPPFNWQLDRRLAEFEAGGGLYAVYFGTHRPVIARQTMALNAPGRYRLDVGMSGELSDSGGSLAWQIQCVPSTVLVADLRIDRLAATPTRYEAEFDVPAGCSFQDIQLRGVPGEFPRRVRAQIQSVEIGRVSADEAPE